MKVVRTGDVSTGGSATGLPDRNASIYQRGILLAIIMLTLITSCQSTPPESESFRPPYLQLRLCGGDASSQLPESTEWQGIAEEILIRERVRLRADPTEGARFCLGDDSVMELAPAAQVALENPRILPQLQIVLEEGSLQFSVQKPSYAFLLPGCSLEVASVPSRLTIERVNDGVHLLVDEGALTCTSETGTVTLVRCQDLRASAGMDPEIGQFCEATAIPTAAFPSATPTPAGPTATATDTPTPSPTVTPTPRPQLPQPTATPTIATPTEAPTAPPPPQAPPPTSPPQPRPTNTPVPPPTNTPLPPPTDTPPPPPPPTDTPRPTPTAPPTPRPTPAS